LVTSRALVFAAETKVREILFAAKRIPNTTLATIDQLASGSLSAARESASGLGGTERAPRLNPL